MTTFPELTPATRTFTPGRHPHSEIPSMSGLQSRVRTSNAIIEQRLQLTFVALTEAQMLSIRSHYIDRQGRFLSFAIPNSLLSGMLAPASFTLFNGSWLYANSPQVEDVPGLNRYTVNVELVNAPPENAVASGFKLGVTASFEPGEASTAVGGTTTLEFDPPLEIDGGFDSVPLEVVGVAGLATKVEVTVSLTKFASPWDDFTYNQEVSFFLLAPNDQNVAVALTYGFPVGQAVPVGGSVSATVTFGDDYDPYPDPPGPTDLVSGSYAPDEPLSYFTDYATASGTWTFIYSDVYPDEGKLQIHSISISVT